MTHLTQEQLELLLQGEPPAADDARLRHLALCPMCARRLAEVARVEQALHDAVESSESAGDRGARATNLPAPWRYVLAAAAVLVVLIALAQVLAPGPERSASRQVAATQLLVPPDTPCLVDPLALGPGHDVVAPNAICRNVTAPVRPLTRDFSF